MKVALLTGGNKGIGYELCRNLVQAGHFVLLAARNETLGLEAIERLKRHLEDWFGMFQRMGTWPPTQG